MIQLRGARADLLSAWFGSELTGKSLVHIKCLIPFKLDGNINGIHGATVDRLKKSVLEEICARVHAVTDATVRELTAPSVDGTPTRRVERRTLVAKIWEALGATFSRRLITDDAAKRLNAIVSERLQSAHRAAIAVPASADESRDRKRPRDATDASGDVTGLRHQNARLRERVTALRAENETLWTLLRAGEEARRPRIRGLYGAPADAAWDGSASQVDDDEAAPMSEAALDDAEPATEGDDSGEAAPTSEAALDDAPRATTPTRARRRPHCPRQKPATGTPRIPTPTRTRTRSTF
jgi:hypothetical protein